MIDNEKFLLGFKHFFNEDLILSKFEFPTSLGGNALLIHLGKSINFNFDKSVMLFERLNQPWIKFQICSVNSLCFSVDLVQVEHVRSLASDLSLQMEEKYFPVSKHHFEKEVQELPQAFIEFQNPLDGVSMREILKPKALLEVLGDPNEIRCFRKKEKKKILQSVSCANGKIDLKSFSRNRNNENLHSQFIQESEKQEEPSIKIEQNPKKQIVRPADVSNFIEEITEYLEEDPLSQNEKEFQRLTAVRLLKLETSQETKTKPKDSRIAHHFEQESLQQVSYNLQSEFFQSFNDDIINPDSCLLENPSFH